MNESNTHNVQETAATDGAPPALSSTSAPLLPTKARIALFTVRDFAIEHALPIIASRPDAELAVVLTTPGPKGRRSPAHLSVMEALHRLGHANVDVLCSNKKSKWPDLLALYDVNLILVSGFPWLIPAAVLDDPRIALGVINFHNSHLPRFQGPNAFGHYMLTGESSVGYCCHRMSAEFDTGPILFTETVPLDMNEDYQDLKLKMPAVFSGMIDKAITLALKGEPGIPQTGTPSHAPKFDDAFRWIDFQNASARDVHNKVRAYYGERDHPKGALANLDDGTVICITKTRYHPVVKVLGMPPPSPVASSSSSNNHNTEFHQYPADDPDVASVASLTTLSSEGMTTTASSSYYGTSNRNNEGSGIMGGSYPGAMMSGPFLGGSSRECSVAGDDSPFFVQCGDTALEILEWHRVREGTVGVPPNLTTTTTPTKQPTQQQQDETGVVAVSSPLPIFA
jgi:methionyl-tRNA formyltransferase